MKKIKEMKETKMKTSMLLSNLIKFYSTLDDLVGTTRRLITRTGTRRTRTRETGTRETGTRGTGTGGRGRGRGQDHVIDERTAEIAEMSSEMTFILQF